MCSSLDTGSCQRVRLEENSVISNISHISDLFLFPRLLETWTNDSWETFIREDIFGKRRQEHFIAGNNICLWKLEMKKFPVSKSIKISTLSCLKKIFLFFSLWVDISNYLKHCYESKFCSTSFVSHCLLTMNVCPSRYNISIPTMRHVFKFRHGWFVNKVMSW